MPNLFVVAFFCALLTAHTAHCRLSYSYSRIFDRKSSKFLSTLSIHPLSSSLPHRSSILKLSSSTPPTPLPPPPSSPSPSPPLPLPSSSSSSLAGTNFKQIYFPTSLFQHSSPSFTSSSSSSSSASSSLFPTSATTTSTATTPTAAESSISWNEFSTAITSNGFTAPTRAQYDAFMRGLVAASGAIADKHEAAMLLAHLVWESGGLRQKRQLICIATGCPGMYDQSVGVEGRNYYGRGYIQLTHSYNYREASIDLFGDLRLITNPDIVADDEEVAWATAFWFWKRFVHSRAAVRARKFGDTTRAINVIECVARMPEAKRRFEFYKRILRAFNIADQPDERGCYD